MLQIHIVTEGINHWYYQTARLYQAIKTSWVFSPLTLVWLSQAYSLANPQHDWIPLPSTVLLEEKMLLY